MTATPPAPATELPGFVLLAEKPCYADFRFEATIDFIEVIVRLSSHSHGGKFKGIAGAGFARPLDKDVTAGDRASEFVLHYDDVKRWDDLQLQLDDIEEKYGFVQPPEIVAIELSLDARHLEGDAGAHRDLVKRLFRLSAMHCSDNARLVREKGETLSAEQTPWLSNKVDAGFTIVIGSVKDAVLQRIYFKTTTRVSGKTELLPEAQHQARIELKLQGTGLPFRTVADARQFRFETLSKAFYMRELRKDARSLTAMSKLLLARRQVLGVRAARGRRVFDRHTVADREFNAIAYDSFRLLTKRLRGSSPAYRRSLLHKKPVTGTGLSA